MTPTDYISESGRTDLDWTGYNNSAQRAAYAVNDVHAAFGLSTESGEILDMYKKHIFYGKPIDLVNLQEELGDVMWYIAIFCRQYGFSIEQLMEDNIKKLAKRFPEKFTEHHANNRDTVNELSHITV